MSLDCYAVCRTISPGDAKEVPSDSVGVKGRVIFCLHFVCFAMSNLDQEMLENITSG